MSKVLRLGLMVIAASLLSLPVTAQQAPPSADTFVNSGAPSTNFGSSSIDVVGSGNTTYIRFNLSGVPVGPPVSKATLRLYVDAVSSGGQFDVYNLPSTPAWSENTLKFNNAAAGAGHLRDGRPSHHGFRVEYEHVSVDRHHGHGARLADKSLEQ